MIIPAQWHLLNEIVVSKYVQNIGLAWDFPSNTCEYEHGDIEKPEFYTDSTSLDCKVEYIFLGFSDYLIFVENTTQ